LAFAFCAQYPNKDEWRKERKPMGPTPQFAEARNLVVLLRFNPRCVFAQVGRKLASFLPAKSTVGDSSILQNAAVPRVLWAATPAVNISKSLVQNRKCIPFNLWHKRGFMVPKQLALVGERRCYEKKYSLDCPGGGTRGLRATK
jgi:hypothetical protein